MTFLNKPMILVKKSQSGLMRLIAKLPFIPESFMRRFWTTIGHKVYVPSVHDNDKDWGTVIWGQRNRVALSHERVHIVQVEKLSFPLFAILYVGPSAILAPLTILLIPTFLISWWIPIGLLLSTLLLAPLSVGLAWGRWRIEREAYMVQMLTADTANIPNTARWIADTLYLDYFFTWPRKWASRWFLSEVKRRSATRGE
jgi:hypothetical protein